MMNFGKLAKEEFVRQLIDRSNRASAGPACGLLRTNLMLKVDRK
jgi:hypothetical protein